MYVCIYIYIYIYIRTNILHTRNRRLRSRRGCSAACSKGLSLPQWIVTRKCPMDFHWRFPLEFHFCEFWCVVCCPDPLARPHPRRTPPRPSACLRICIGMCIGMCISICICIGICIGIGMCICIHPRPSACTLARACTRALRLHVRARAWFPRRQTDKQSRRRWTVIVIISYCYYHYHYCC